jgi:serine/threonine-protein kinase
LLLKIFSSNFKYNMGRELPQGTRVGVCTVERLHERSGLYEVYAALGPTGQACRLSIYHVDPDGQAWRRFVAEAEQLTTLAHPCLAQIVETAVTADGQPYQVVALGPGDDLATRLRSTGALTSSEALVLAQQIGAALHAIHALDLVHRGLTPERVFVCDSAEPVRPRVRLLDAGVTRLIDDAAAGGFVGSPEYKAPEQLTGFSIDVGPASDQYALALLLYQALTSSRPLKADSPAATILQVVRGGVEPLRALRPDLPRGIDSAVMRALSKERTARYPSVAEFLLALQGTESIAPAVDELVGGWLRSADSVQAAIRQAQAQADSKPSFQVVALGMGGGAVPEVVEDQATVPNTMDEVMRLAVPVEQIPLSVQSSPMGKATPTSGSVEVSEGQRASQTGLGGTAKGDATNSQSPTAAARDDDKTDENVRLENTGPLSAPAAAPLAPAVVSPMAGPPPVMGEPAALVKRSPDAGLSPPIAKPAKTKLSEQLVLLFVGLVLGFLFRHLLH